MNIFILAFICLFLQAIRGIPDFIHLITFLKKLKNKDDNFFSAKENGSRKIFILLPLLNEQKIYRETISYFLENFNTPYVFIVIITSSREIGEHSTFNFIKKDIENRLWDNNTDRIKLLNEENKNSNMATQLNFAVNEIVGLDIKNKEEAYILYNADSRPSSLTLNYFTEYLKKHSAEDNFAIQQPCVFIKDIGKNNFVNALSLYQTWFCLGHENRILKNYEISTSSIAEQKIPFMKELFNSQLGYSVGHGSSMKFSTLLNNGGYPENLLTEDLTLGYFLSAKKVPIINLDVLEVADVPFDFTSYIKQRNVWFWNYLEYFSCFFDKKVQDVSMTRKLKLLIVGIGRGSYWLVSSFLYLFPIIFGFFYQNIIVIVLGVVGLFIFQVLPVLYLLKNLPSILEKQKLGVYANKLKSLSMFKVSYSTIFLVFTDSFGPWIAIIRYLITQERPRKYKTQR
ncbi:MAG: glycosyltransferase family 2 protein [Candidatus Paceibacterota bacterium]